MERSGNFYKAIRLGYILISILIGCMAYNSLYEWQEIEALELGNKKIDELRKEINNINIQMIKFSLLGETILEWNDKDIEHYHARRMAMDSMLCRFKATYPAERIDSVRSLLEDKERQMFQIVRLMDEQQSINKKIANQIPVIVQKSVQEQSKKPKRKGFLGIFGKKEGTKPTTTTTTLRSSNRNMVNEQKAQSRRLSEQADSLAARNAELNRQLQGLICQIEKKVQSDLQNRESEITAMRKKSFMQIGGLMGFVLLLLVISYIIIHRDAKNIKRYKRKTTDLIEQLEQSVQQNEVLITSRKKAVHTIIHKPLYNGCRQYSSSCSSIQQTHLRFCSVIIEERSHIQSCGHVRKELTILFPFRFWYCIYETVCILNYQFNHTSSFFVLSTINSLSSTESSWAIRYSVSRLGCCLLQQ